MPTVVFESGEFVNYQKVAASVRGRAPEGPAEELGWLAIANGSAGEGAKMCDPRPEKLEHDSIGKSKFLVLWNWDAVF